MPKYYFTAINQAGITSKGERQAKSKDEVYRILSNRGYSVLTISEIKEKRDINAMGWVSHIDIMLFTKNMSTMLKGGLNIMDALEISKSQAKGKFKKILSDVIQKVSAGRSLADGLRAYQKHFPPSYLDIVRTGEISGKLAENLEHLGVQLEKDHSMRRKVQTAMVYPAFILGTTLALGIILSTFVLPRLNRLFNSMDMDLPLATKVLMWLAQTFQDYGIWIFLALAGIIIFVRWLTKLKFIKPFYHRLILAIPLVGKLSRQFNLARFSRSLGSLLQSGLPITEALKAVVMALENVRYKKAISEVLTDIEKGSSLAKALGKHSKIFPSMSHRLILAAEESGQLEETLFYLANYYEEEVDNTTKNLSVVIEPTLLIIIGAVVGFIGLSIVTPIYQITSHLGQ